MTAGRTFGGFFHIFRIGPGRIFEDSNSLECPSPARGSTFTAPKGSRKGGNQAGDGNSYTTLMLRNIGFSDVNTLVSHAELDDFWDAVNVAPPLKEVTEKKGAVRLPPTALASPREPSTWFQASTAASMRLCRPKGCAARFESEHASLRLFAHGSGARRL